MRKMITNFYCDPANIKQDNLTIVGEEKKHIVSVLRHKKGDLIDVVNGVGNKYVVKIVDIARNELRGEIVSREKVESEPRICLTLAQSVCKGYKMDWVVEKATEIGVCSIIPLITEKTDVKIESGKKEKVKTERWKRKALSAMKQSLRSRLPVIEGAITLEALLSRVREFDLALFGTLEADAVKLKQKALFKNDPKRILAIVGPEAGFTGRELRELSAAHAIGVDLGKRRLRAETAGILLAFLVLHELDQ